MYVIYVCSVFFEGGGEIAQVLWNPWLNLKNDTYWQRSIILKLIIWSIAVTVTFNRKTRHTNAVRTVACLPLTEVLPADLFKHLNYLFVDSRRATVAIYMSTVFQQFQLLHVWHWFPARQKEHPQTNKPKPAWHYTSPFVVFYSGIKHMRLEQAEKRKPFWYRRNPPQKKKPNPSLTYWLVLYV